MINSQNTVEKQIQHHLQLLNLPYMNEKFMNQAQHAANQQQSHLDFLCSLLEGEALIRQNSCIERRLKQAKMPYVKTLEEFKWSHPQKINPEQIRYLFNLKFLQEKENVVFIGPTGVGKTHLAIALARAACHQNHSVLFTTALSMINKLNSAMMLNEFEKELKRYTRVELLVIDELGYMPIGKNGSDLLFQVTSSRYEQGSTIITTNCNYSDWLETFNNNAAITSAVLDRIVHHCHSIFIEGESYRMKSN